MRLELGPLVPRLPILSGAVSLTFMEEPFLDFDIKVFALNVAVRPHSLLTTIPYACTSRDEVGRLDVLPRIADHVLLSLSHSLSLSFSHSLVYGEQSVGMPDLSVGDTVAWVIRENVFRESTYYPNRLVFPILHDIVVRPPQPSHHSKSRPTRPLQLEPAHS